jgi:hypothetical protein
MGNQDNWTTPKQIKIERAGEPRGTRRGNRKKGQRKKGRKARIDEILSAKKNAERYRQYVQDDKKRCVEHPEWYTTKPDNRLRRYDPKYIEWFDESKIELDKRIEKAIKDGVIDKETADYYKVELYPF